MKRWKKYVAAKAQLEALKAYPIAEAVALAKKLHYAKFVGSLDLNIKTIADPKYNDQMIRGTVVLPHGNGKKVSIAAYVSDDMIEEAKKAGATLVWNREIISKVESGEFNFDVMITTPDMMRDLAKVAKVLGPKGLMPSPKAGTVTTDIVGTINEISKWRIEFKLDKTGNIHVGAGKLDFSDQQLIENVTAVITAVENLKPAVLKNRLFKKVTIAPSMGPGIQIQS